jgi:hypothetical protein
MIGKQTKPSRDKWLTEAAPLLKAAATELKQAKALGAPGGKTDDNIDFQIAVLAEEVGDVYTRLHDLTERVDLETGH